jgi:hypothetical protein
MNIKGLGCLGVLLDFFIWDLLFCIFICVFFLPEKIPFFDNIHIVFRILMSIALFAGLQKLFKSKRFGKFFIILMGVFWFCALWYVGLNKDILSLVNGDKIWYHTIQVLLFVVIVGLHFSSFAKIELNNNAENNINTENDTDTNTSNSQNISK